MIQYKSFSFDLKDLDSKRSQFEGYSAGIGNEDLGRDIIEPGAFNKTIQERVASGSVKLLDNHSRSSTKNVWGTVIRAEEVEMDNPPAEGPTHKLLTEFKVSEKDQDAQTALAKVEEGHLNQLSIGYKPIKVDYTVDDESEHNDDPFFAWLVGEASRHIKELAWWETSLVIWGMNPEATTIENSVKTIQHFAEVCKRDNSKIPPRYVEAAVKAMNSLIELDINYEQIDKVKNVVNRLEEETQKLENVERDMFTYLINEYKESNDNPSREHFFIWFTENVKDNELLEFDEAAPEDNIDESDEGSKESDEGEDVESIDSDDTSLRALAEQLKEIVTLLRSVTNTEEAVSEEDNEEEKDKEEAAAESTSEKEEAAESTSDDKEKDVSESLKVALELADMDLNFN